jgi:hypothetical protein
MKKHTFKFEKSLSLIEAISKAHSKTMTVTFIKANGELRTLLCKKNIKRFLSKKPNKKVVKSSQDVVRVFDMESKSYKSFRLDSVKEVKYGNVIWSAE